MKNDRFLFTFILFIYIILPIIISLSECLFKYKFFILTIVGIMLYVLFRKSSISNENLGITKRNSIKSLKRNIPIIIVAISLIILIKLMGITRFKSNETIIFYLFYIFISCPLQEFLYRGVFGYFDGLIISNSTFTTILSSFCYSFVHIIYKDVLTLILTFIIGIIWYSIYKKDKSLFGVSISHIVLGILTISLGIIN